VLSGVTPSFAYAPGPAGSLLDEADEDEADASADGSSDVVSDELGVDGSALKVGEATSGDVADAAATGCFAPDPPPLVAIANAAPPSATTAVPAMTARLVRTLMILPSPWIPCGGHPPI
jgi:hypothetical protein